MAALSAVSNISVALLVMLAASPVLAEDAANVDWPCMQHKVPTLTSTQMWDGPSVDDLDPPSDNEAIRKLIPFLESRRVPIEDAAQAIAQFAEAQPPEKRDDALKLLFAGLLSAINNDRTIVMRGLERFQQRQKARAAEIERQGAAIRDLKEKAGSNDAARKELVVAQEKYTWDVRVFTERQQSLPLACDVPVQIEQRLFALAREIRSHMNE